MPQCPSRRSARRQNLKIIDAESWVEKQPGGDVVRRPPARRKTRLTLFTNWLSRLYPANLFRTPIG